MAAKPRQQRKYSDRNIMDRMGDKHYAAKMTDDDVRDIRRRLNMPYPPMQTDLAKEYHVSAVCIWKIYHRKTWKHL